MRISKRLFQRIKRLYEQMDEERYANAQGDSGMDILHREEIYRARLEKILKENT